jgi:hypothetical protein
VRGAGGQRGVEVEDRVFRVPEGGRGIGHGGRHAVGQEPADGMGKLVGQ